MPKARSKPERARQVEQWLRDHFPTPYPVDVIHRFDDWRDDEGDRIFGDSELVDGRIRIRLNLRAWLEFVIETLIHEWSHAVDWRTPRLEEHREEHPDEWGLSYARVYREFYDNRGWEDSRLYDGRRS
jgi:hypothetical protein